MPNPNPAGDPEVPGTPLNSSDNAGDPEVPGEDNDTMAFQQPESAAGDPEVPGNPE